MQLSSERKCTLRKLLITFASDIKIWIDGYLAKWTIYRLDLWSEAQFLFSIFHLKMVKKNARGCRWLGKSNLGGVSHLVPAVLPTWYWDRATSATLDPGCITLHSTTLRLSLFFLSWNNTSTQPRHMWPIQSPEYYSGGGFDNLGPVQAEFFLIKCWKFDITFQIQGSNQGWAGIPVSRDSREYKPQISLPFPSRGIL